MLKNFEEAREADEVNHHCLDCNSINSTPICTSCDAERGPGLSSGSQQLEDAMPAMHELMKDIPGEDEGNVEKNTVQRLQRVHRNLGHPPNRLPVHILKEAETPERVIDVAKK